MDYTNKQLTDPATLPLTLEMAKRHLAIGHDDDDEIITKDIHAALALCEAHTNRVFGSRSFLFKCREWPCNGYLYLPVEPVTAITAVRYTDYEDAAQTVSASDYFVWLDHSPPMVKLKTGFGYPSLQTDNPAPVEVEYVAGEAAPPMLQKAIELCLEYWRKYPGGEDNLGHLSRGLPAGAIRILDSLWNGAM